MGALHEEICSQKPGCRGRKEGENVYFGYMADSAQGQVHELILFSIKHLPVTELYPFSGI